MAICEKCGAKVPDGAKFCTECGTLIQPQVLSDAGCPQEIGRDAEVIRPGDFKEESSIKDDTAPTFVEEEMHSEGYTPAQPQNTYSPYTSPVQNQTPAQQSPYAAPYQAPNTQSPYSAPYQDQAQGTYNQPYQQPYAQPYPAAVQTKKKFPAWAIILIVVGVVVVVGGGICAAVFGIIGAVGDPGKTVSSFCDAAESGDILSMAQCLDDYAGYTDEEINTELAEYMTDSETQSMACLSAFDTFLYYFADDYDYPDVYNGVDSIDCSINHVEVENDSAEIGGTLTIVIDGETSTVNFNADLMKYNEKWYLDI